MIEWPGWITVDRRTLATTQKIVLIAWFVIFIASIYGRRPDRISNTSDRFKRASSELDQCANGHLASSALAHSSRSLEGHGIERPHFNRSKSHVNPRRKRKRSSRRRTPTNFVGNSTTPEKSQKLPHRRQRLNKRSKKASAEAERRRSQEEAFKSKRMEELRRMAREAILKAKEFRREELRQLKELANSTRVKSKSTSDSDYTSLNSLSTDIDLFRQS
mmetsp:Transcript_3117/g.7271  ORF Transcript_3117/g.7271 Transcript_3117/m.7271 type:complete len:218 (+) Transcript_3117:326-979(+)